MDSSLSTGADFEHMFDLAPVSLWLEDYSALKQLFDGWRAEVSAKAIADLRAKVAKFEDETPVDEAWLREQFGEPGNWFGELFWAIAPYAKACVADDGIEIVVGLQRVSTNPTRGQLAKLIDGLGVRV